jgi:hypothetical protein
MLNKVKLLNGTEVDWEEFSLWSNKKQRANLIGYEWPSKEKMSLLIKEGRKKAGLYDNPYQKQMIDRKGGFVCPYGHFANRIAAAKYAQSKGLNNAIKKFSQLCKTDPSNYYYVQGPYSKKSRSVSCKPINTPFGVFESKKDAMEEMHRQGIPNVYHALKKALLRDPKNYFFIEKNS